MANALNYLYQIFDGFVNMVFNDFELFSGVTVGWIAVSVTPLNNSKSLKTILTKPSKI